MDPLIDNLVKIAMDSFSRQKVLVSSESSTNNEALPILHYCDIFEFDCTILWLLTPCYSIFTRKLELSYKNTLEMIKLISMKLLGQKISFK